MKPRKAKELIPVTARILDVSEELVNDVISYYWQEIRKSMSSLKHNRIHITNLGDFIIKEWKIDGKIDMLEKWEESNRQKGLQQITSRFKTAESLFDLKSIKTILAEEKQRKDFISLHKSTYNESTEKHMEDLEE